MVRVIIGLIFAMYLAGCSTTTTGKLMKLNLGMSKEAVIKAIGEPTAARGAFTNKYDQVIEVYEYQEYKTPDNPYYVRPTSYLLFFYNGKLVQWGEAGDWKDPADRIYEIRFR